MSSLTNALTPAQIMFSMAIIAMIFFAILINLNKRKETEILKTIPSGFVEAEFGLLLNKEKFDNLQHIIMPQLIRDYLFYYSFNTYDDVMFNVEFYVRENDKASFMYRLGIYSQTIQNYQTVEKLQNINHVVPENFPECIEIKMQD